MLPRGSLFRAIGIATLAATQCVAQPAVTCSANPLYSYSLRMEGLAELMADVEFYCYNDGSTTVIVPMDLRLALETNVTSNRDFGQGADFTDAQLIYYPVCNYWPCPAPPPPVFGRLLADNRTLQWTPVAAIPPSSMGAVRFRIVNVRGKVFGLGAAPVTLFATATISSPMPLYFPSQRMVLGYAENSLTTSVLASSGTESFRIQIDERHSFAFKRLGMPRTDFYSYDPNQEDGYFAPGSGVNNGGATQGTRLLIELLGVPGGVRVLVPHIVPATGTSSSLEIRRVEGADANGAGGCIYQLTCLEPPPAGNLALVPVTRGTGSVVYEVTTPSYWYNIDRVEIPVMVCHGPANNTECRSFVNQTALRGLKVRVSLAPVSTVATSDPAAPEPRFVNVSAPVDVPQ